MTREEILDYQAKTKAFYETELGKVFRNYETDLINYWRHDGDERISDRRLRELDDKSRTSRKVFWDMLQSLVK